MSFMGSKVNKSFTACNYVVKTEKYISKRKENMIGSHNENFTVNDGLNQE